MTPEQVMTRYPFFNKAIYSASTSKEHQDLVSRIDNALNGNIIKKQEYDILKFAINNHESLIEYYPN